MTFFDKTTLEGLVFLEKGVVSGFNKEDDEFLNAISLNVKYYHSILEHITLVTRKIREEFKGRFGKEPEIREHSKIGIFRWETYFDIDQSYRYFVVTKSHPFVVVEIMPGEVSTYAGKEFLVATSQDKIIDFIIRSGPEGELIYKYLRMHSQKKLLADGKLIDNPEVIDERCHQIPLFVVNDKDGLIQDKSGLVEVTNLKFQKEGICLQSLVKPGEVRKILARLGSFDCDFTLRKETRYVSLEFASYM